MDDRPDFYRARDAWRRILYQLQHFILQAMKINQTDNNLERESTPKMILVVNQKVALWSDVESWLSENYELVQTDTSELTL